MGVKAVIDAGNGKEAKRISGKQRRAPWENEKGPSRRSGTGQRGANPL